MRLPRLRDGQVGGIGHSGVHGHAVQCTHCADLARPTRIVLVLQRTPIINPGIPVTGRLWRETVIPSNAKLAGVMMQPVRMPDDDHAIFIADDLVLRVAHNPPHIDR